MSPRNSPNDSPKDSLGDSFIGQTLGTYRVIERIGAGGMGEVYRATDTTLKRDVAIKLLPAEFARDSERVARFKREAQLLASLNHPNIATIHGLHNDGQQYFLVMELVGGEDLSQRIRRDGALPLDEALTIVTQVCEALEHAHEHGVIHRDLKPANVKVTPEGKVKVLDFGLAKAFAADGASGEASPNHGVPYDSQSPTLTASPTIPGVILGTAAYMSPEQARGKPVDKRTDIWALGCVLYELLTGRQVFMGESTVEILGALQHQEPDWLLLPAGIPAFVRGILRRCLQKDKLKRLAGAGDISIQIQDAAAGAALEGGQAGTVAAAELAAERQSAERLAAEKAALATEKAAAEAALETSVRRGRKQARIAWALAVALAIIVGVAAWKMKPAAPPQPVSRVAITLPPGQRLARLDQPAIAISPDICRVTEQRASTSGHGWAGTRAW